MQNGAQVLPTLVTRQADLRSRLALPDQHIRTKLETLGPAQRLQSSAGDQL
jgi:hypothetical protein